MLTKGVPQIACQVLPHLGVFADAPDVVRSMRAAEGMKLGMRLRRSV